MTINIINCLKQYNDINKETLSSILARTVLASLLASNGLLNNNLTSLIPAMIISPIGSLLLDLTINFISLTSFNLTAKSIKSIGLLNINKQLLSFLLIILLAIIIGVIYGNIYVRYKKVELPTKEMKSRMDKSAIIESIIIAVACSIALPISYIRKDVSTLISIAIATALLPPLVNIGIVLGTYYTHNDYYRDTELNPINNEGIIKKAIKYGSIIFLINATALILASFAYIKYKCLYKNIKINQNYDVI
tara:strand:+ start:92 stop:838 length:747 start_codon:yes stop_codon:yes gene_type:complete